MADSTNLKKTGSEQGGTKFAPGKSGNPNGRPKGVPNKTTTLLKDAILQAAQKAGGDGDDGLVNYLTVQASENPQSFMPLLGKVLPMQITGEDGRPIEIKITRQIVDPRGDA